MPSSTDYALQKTKKQQYRHGDRTPAHWTQHAIGSKTITVDELAFWSATNRNLIPSKAVTAEWQQYCPNAGGDMV